MGPQLIENGEGGGLVRRDISSAFAAIIEVGETPPGRRLGPTAGWWRVWACSEHLDGLTGLREFGRRQDA